VDRREREGPRLLLNQGPSEPCYATGKVLDLNFLSKYSDNLCTSDLQFGFKAGHSTMDEGHDGIEGNFGLLCGGWWSCVLYISGCHKSFRPGGLLQTFPITTKT